jgi:gluconate 2-dehydrogenase gamma chain
LNTKDFDAAEPARRTLLKLVGAGAAGALPVAARAQPAPAAPAAMPGMAMPQARPDAGKPPPAGYVFFNEDESAVVEAMVNCLIPADEYGPAGVDLGVATFMDRQLDGGYGRGERMYLLGPFLEGTPEQGYQLQLPPAELVRTGLADLADHLQSTRKTTFDALPPADQVAVLTDLQHGRIELARVPTGAVFGVLFQLAMDGFFCDPIYGGNRDKASWKMLGYPGVGDMYADKIGPNRNKLYRADAKSIQDLA